MMMKNEEMIILFLLGVEFDNCKQRFGWCFKL